MIIVITIIIIVIIMIMIIIMITLPGTNIMVGILLSYWGGLFSGAMLVSGRVSWSLSPAGRGWNPSQIGSR